MQSITPDSSHQPVRARRCQLSVPGSSAAMLTKAAALSIDGVILDLEDAVAPEAKNSARNQIIESLQTQSWQARCVSVRINDVTTSWCHDDIIELVTRAGNDIDTLVLAKTQKAADVLFVHTLLDQLEQKLGLTKRIGIEALIEDVQGMTHVDAIAACSNRLEALVLGMGDYAASQSMQIETIGGIGDYPGDIWHYPRFKLIVAARANELDPIDGPYANFKDQAGLIADSKRAAALGMAGKWAIHPSQQESLEAVFSPNPEALDKARKQHAAYQEALAAGIGAVSIDGVMLDAASIRMIEKTLERARLMGM